MAKKSHSGDSYRLSRKVPTSESFFIENLELYVNEGLASFENQAKIAFKGHECFDWVSVVMRPCLCYSFFKLVEIGGDRDLFNIFYQKAQNVVYENKHYFVSILYGYFLCDKEWFNSSKSRNMFREVFINLLKSCADRYQDEKLKECLSAEESIAIIVQCGADLNFIERMNDISGSVNQSVANFLNAEYLKVLKAQQATENLISQFKETETITSETTCQGNETFVVAQEEVPLTQQPVSSMPKKQMKKDSSPKTLEDLNAKFGMELEKDLSELESVIMDFCTDEDWNVFVEERNVRLGQTCHRHGSHESQAIVFDFEGRETKGLLLTYYIHGTDTKIKGGVKRTVKITRRIQK